MKLLKNIHPGETLLKEFLIPSGISQSQLAKDIGMSYSSVARIIKGEQAITPETAMKLADYFDTNPKFWLSLQNSYNLGELRRKNTALFLKIQKTIRAKRHQKLKKLKVG